MIKASQMIRLLEEWASTTAGYKFEVLVNPLTWMEAARNLKDGLRDVVYIQHANPILRYGYDTETEKIKTWVGYLAIHEMIYPPGEPDWEQVIFGCIDTRKRLSMAIYAEYSGKSTDTLQDLPKRLQHFLKGTRLVNHIEDALIF
jgi:hypothetical protein